METVAWAEGISVAEEIRNAITAHLSSKRTDEAFRARLAQLIEKQQGFLREDTKT